MINGLSSSESATSLMAIPWNDHAVLIRSALTGGERKVVKEDALHLIVDRLIAMTTDERSSLSISMPDRHVAPFGYTKGELIDLMLARTGSRLK